MRKMGDAILKTLAAKHRQLDELRDFKVPTLDACYSDEDVTRAFVQSTPCETKPTSPIIECRASSQSCRPMSR